MKKIIVTLLSLYLTHNLSNAQIKMEDFNESGRYGRYGQNGYILPSVTIKEVMENENGIHCIVAGGKEIYILNKNVSNITNFITNSQIHVWRHSDHPLYNYVWFVDNYENITKKKFVRYIPSYIPFSEEDELNYNKYQKEKHKIIIMMLAEQRKKQEADSIKRSEINVRALQNRKEQATNGLPTFQYQLGVSYITGADGETNKSLGRYWLIRSAAQGNEDAENYLKDLK